MYKYDTFTNFKTNLKWTTLQVIPKVFVRSTKLMTLCRRLKENISYFVPKYVLYFCVKINCHNKYSWNMNTFNAHWRPNQDCAQLSYGTYSNYLIYGLDTTIVCCRSGKNGERTYEPFNFARRFHLIQVRFYCYHMHRFTCIHVHVSF